MIPIRNVYYLLCYAWGHLEERDLVDRTALENLNRVEDLFGKVLAEGTFRLLKRGLDRGYRETTEELAGVRGKLEVGAMATTAIRARGRTICTFEIFTPDILHNQILRSTLGTLLRNPKLDSKVRQDVALAYQKLNGISDVRVTRQIFSRVQLSRSQRHYGFLLQICELVHDLVLIGEESGDASFWDFRRDEARMWKLFEDFVREFYRVEQSEYRVLPERKVSWYFGGGEPDRNYVPDMYADIILEGTGRRIILDTKFYGKPLDSRYGPEKLRSSNLYQLLAYLNARQMSLPEGPRHEGMLLYAAVDGEVHADVELNGFEVRARSIDLTEDFTTVHQALLSRLPS